MTHFLLLPRILIKRAGGEYQLSCIDHFRFPEGLTMNLYSLIGAGSGEDSEIPALAGQVQTDI